MKSYFSPWFCLAILIILFLNQSSQSQTYIPPDPWQVDTLIVVSDPEYQYLFPEKHRPQYQSILILRNRMVLVNQRDYQIIDQRRIDFFSALEGGDSLRIQYRREPVDYQSQYVLFERDTLQQQDQDSVEAAGTRVRLQRVQWENPFASMPPGLQTSGSIMRGVQIGTNRDLTLNSGLNLELSGRLTENLEVVAALTDEATPIQPEGNTQTLDEIDKVFVSFKSPYVQGTVGDFNLQYGQTEFGKLSRKLQGITLLSAYQSSYLGATIASTRGFFHRNQFIGQEGNQGPYQLTGKGGEREIIVLAGTERVWINGERMLRGESNDYIIEYGNGQIFFTNRRLISSESRVEIDFEYFPATQKYNRNVYSGNFGTALAKDKFQFKMHFFRESDDPDQVFRDAGAAEKEEKEILKQAGDDPTRAFTPGETYVGPGNGTYMKVDTLIQTQAYSYFKYVGRNQGDYVVTFSFVPEGDYVRDRLGVYRFAGIGKGSYLPRKFIALPSAHDLLDFQIEWQPNRYYRLRSEYALSRLDRNILSDLDDADNQGSALQVQAELRRLPLSFRRLPLGNINLDLNTRYIENNFQSVDRLNAPDHQRYWNLLPTVRDRNEEISVQLNTLYQPHQTVDIHLNGGVLQKSDFQSQRYLGSFRFDQDRIGHASAKYEYVGSNLSKINLQNDWWRYSGRLQRDLWKFSGELLYAGEHRKNRSRGQLSGFQFDDPGMRLGLKGFTYVQGFYQYNRRSDALYDFEGRGTLVPQAITQTNQLGLELQNLAETSASLRFVRRSKDFSTAFEEVKVDTLRLLYVDAEVQDTVWQDRTTNLAELNVSHNQWKKALQLNWQYKISTEQIALREKVHIDVGEGRGNLRFDDDLQEYIPDPNGNFVLFILPSGQLQPVSNLQSALRLKFDPARYWSRSGKGWRQQLTKVSGESYIRVEENTREENIWSIYLMDWSKFQGDQTIRGNVTFNQDIFILRNNRNLSFRLRYRYNEGRFNQFLDANENEDRLSRESGLRADWRITTKIRSQSEVRQRNVIRTSKASPLRNRDISGYYYDQRFSYRPHSQWELGLESEYGYEDNTVPNYPLRLWYEALKGRLNYSLPGKGRASAEYVFQVVETTSNPLGLVVPYEMARGKKAGNSQWWEMRVEYTLAKNILFSVYYNGRDEAGFKNVIHSGQAELRAYF